MADDLPENVAAATDAFEQSLNDVEKYLEPLVGGNPTNSKQINHAGLDPLEAAKLDLTKAYALNSLFWMYLTTQGVSPKDHPVKAELERIRNYMLRIKKLQNPDEEEGPKSKLNKGAAKRFVKGALADNERKGKRKAK